MNSKIGESTTPSQESFNITRGQGRTIHEAAKIVADLVPGTRIEVHEANVELPSRGTLDISKARRLIGFEPKVDIEEGIKMYLSYLQKQNEKGLL